MEKNKKNKKKYKNFFIKKINLEKHNKQIKIISYIILTYSPLSLEYTLASLNNIT